MSQRVVLEPIAAPGEGPFWDRRRSQTGVTGPSGKVAFTSVAIGRYSVGLGPIALPGMINPAANPLAPPPVITIAAEGDKVAVEIEVWRGSLLNSEVIMDRANIPRGAKLVLRSLDGSPDVDLPLDVRGRVERLLLPGRYEIELAIPPGYLLVDIVWNGESLPGHVVRFDVREDPRQQNVSWYLSSPSLVTGSVSNAAGDCPVRVVATLIQPGPWIQAATERGGSSFQVIPHQEWAENRKCVYRLWLPDGRFKVQPQGDDLLSSEPESADITIAPGETQYVNFALTTKDTEDATKSQPLTVYVRTPQSRPLPGAIVEIWPPAVDKASADPVKTGHTEGYAGSVQFRGLAEGDYLAAAGHDEFLEGTARVEGYDPKGREPTRVTVTLREGARLHARALDDKDRPVQGVELTYTRLSPLPTLRLANEAFVAKKKTGTALTDVTGHLEIPGLYSGEYRIDARMTGELGPTRFVLVRQGRGAHARSIEVDLDEGERDDVELLVLPAASLSGGLVCSDRGTMPAKVSLRLFPADASVEVIAQNDVLLRGAGADRFHLGPLSPGAYRLVVRPAGQNYWGWAVNELLPDRAAVYPITDLAPFDTGVVEIECGPVVAIVPVVKSKEPLPDLRLGSAHASLRPEDKGRRSVGAEVEMHADRIFLRPLPEGKFRTSVTVEHPYTIPSSITLPEQVLDLTRGTLIELPVAFDRLGGSLEVRGDGKAARMTPESGDPVVRAVLDGKADFPGTTPGDYLVELCGDADCATVTAQWSHAAVRAGRTTFLP